MKNLNNNLIDEAVLPERDPSHSQVELVHALPQREQIAVHGDLHDGLSVDLNDQAPPLLLHGDLQRSTETREASWLSRDGSGPGRQAQPFSTGRR